MPFDNPGFSPPAGIDLVALRDFVLMGLRQYGAGQSTISQAHDGRKAIGTESDQFISTDEFDGGNPFAGIVRVISKATGKAVWSCYYHGWLTDKAEKSGETVLNFLRQALKQPSPMPYRGPERHGSADGALAYKNELELGDLACFFGHESISQGDKLLYYGRYGGGLVDLVQDSGESSMLRGLI